MWVSGWIDGVVGGGSGAAAAAVGGGFGFAGVGVVGAAVVDVAVALFFGVCGWWGGLVLFEVMLLLL